MSHKELQTILGTIVLFNSAMISVVIPTYNESAHIVNTIQRLLELDEKKFINEIIISDGGSTDDTTILAEAEGVKIIVSAKKGRAAQMNYGAAHATSPLLYFLHADTIPPQNFTTDIVQAIEQKNNSGCFMLAFDHAHWFLKANCWFTRFDVNHFRYGDQSLFVTKDAFEKSGGFCEKHFVMEDQEIIKRLKRFGKFSVIKKPVITSARKYLENGVYKTQGIFYLIYFMYKAGYSQTQLLSTYRKLIRQDKL